MTTKNVKYKYASRLMERLSKDSDGEPIDRTTEVDTEDVQLSSKNIRGIISDNKNMIKDIINKELALPDKEFSNDELLQRIFFLEYENSQITQEVERLHRLLILNNIKFN